MHKIRLFHITKEGEKKPKVIYWYIWPPIHSLLNLKNSVLGGEERLGV